MFNVICRGDTPLSSTGSEEGKLGSIIIDISTSGSDTVNPNSLYHYGLVAAFIADTESSCILCSTASASYPSPPIG